jgi:hypothetical protein
MNFDWLKTTGVVAGIGGISLAVVFLVFKEVIRVRNVFTPVTREHTFKLLSKIITYTFVVGILGIVAYVIVSVFTGNIGLSHSEEITSPSTLNSNKIEEKKPESGGNNSNTNQKSLPSPNNNTSKIGAQKQVKERQIRDKPFIVDQKVSNGELKD